MPIGYIRANKVANKLYKKVHICYYVSNGWGESCTSLPSLTTNPIKRIEKMATENVTRADYLALLEGHDWFYAYSDCGRTWRKGRESEQRINALAAADSELAQLLEQYQAFRRGEAEKPTAEVPEEISAEITEAAQNALSAVQGDEATRGVVSMACAEIAPCDPPGGSGGASTAFTHDNLSKLLRDGKVARIEFVKRSTGEARTMRCRLGVRKHLTGGGAAYNAKAKNLLTVFDMDKGGYRSIPVDGVRQVQTCGQTFNV